VTDELRLGPQLVARGVPFRSLGMSRGRDILREPRRAVHALKEWSTDVVISVTVGYLGAALRLGGFGGPIIGIEHGNLIRLTEGPVRREPKALVNRLSGVFTHDAEVAVSAYMARLAEKVPHAPITIIPHGVTSLAAPLPAPTHGPLTVGYAGRLYPGKGVDVLLRATALLREQMPSDFIQVRVAGSGPMHSEWETLARDLGIDDVVSFSGWIDDLEEHWRRCHLCVAPNDTFVESFCMSVAEAMAHGRATVVTNSGALPELVVPGETGLVVPPGDPAGLASGLRAYASDNLMVSGHGLAAWQRARTRYSLSRVARGYVDLCENVIELRRRR
jgi:glycosyltransferase involved in cell wall biosynthesis